MFDDPDFDLQWPADLLADELEANARLSDHGHESLKKLLGEAFAGDGILDRLFDDEFGGSNNRVAAVMGHSGLVTDGFVESLVAAARNGKLQRAQSPAPRWRERTGMRVPASVSPVDEAAQLRSGFQSLLRELDNDGYFDKVAPSVCVDDHEHFDFGLDRVVQEQFGEPVDLSFLPRLNVYLEEATINERPLTRQENPPIADLNDDSLFELIEIFHDLTARPRRASFHDFGDCGYHYSSFAIEPGRRLYRWKVNQLLERFKVPLRLAGEGELRGRLIETTDEAREDLVERAKASADPKDVGSIEHAVDLFRRRGATRQDKRSAINSLHRVFEQHRDLMKVELLSKDESDLFHIANKFDLRHNDAKQKPDYEEAYLDWVFWWYLGTVELVQRLVNSQGSGPTQ